MAIVVEDGTGLSTANAYISVSDFSAYHVAMNNTTAADLTTSEIESAIRYATLWMDARYAWRGTIVNDDQALGLPTENGIDDQGRDIVGLPLKAAHACAELALMHTTNSLKEVYGPRVVEQEVVGAVKRKFSDKTGNEGYRYPLIDQMLKGLYIHGGVYFIESMAS